MTTRTLLRLSCAAAALGAAAGCIGDRPQLWSTPQRVLGPHKVAEQVLWVDASRGLAFALDPAAAPPRVRAVAIPRNAIFATPSPDRAQLLVLSAGKEALRVDQEPETPALTILEPGDAGPAVLRRYPLPSPFDRLALSEDGRWAVAHYAETPTEAAGAGQVFRNLNEVALFDLSREADDENPRLRTLRSFGSAPLGVAFSPEMAIPADGGAKRTLALVLSRSYVTFLDLTHPERAEITVPLVPADSAATVLPQQLIFAPEQATVFLRADGAADLYAMTLEPRKATSATENDFRPVINQPSAGTVARDMILLRDGESTKILTANDGGDLSLIDAATSEFVTIAVGEPVDAILPYPAAKPTAALLYARSAPRPRIHFLELADLAEQREANLTHRSLAKPVHQVLLAPGAQRALVVHNDARDVISVLDLVGEHHTDTPIRGQQSLRSFDFAGERFLVGVSPGVARLGILDLEDFHPYDVRLDHDPQRVLSCGDAIVVDHGAPAGLVTVLPRTDAEREDAVVLWGFFYAGLLDSELKD